MQDLHKALVWSVSRSLAELNRISSRRIRANPQSKSVRSVVCSFPKFYFLPRMTRIELTFHGYCFKGSRGAELLPAV